MQGPRRAWQWHSLRALTFSVGALAVSCGDNGTPTPPGGPDAGGSAVAPPSTIVPPVAAPHVASHDDRAQVPAFVWADPALKGLAASQGIVTAEAAARAQLRSYASLYRLSATDIASLDLRDLHDTGRGPIIARFARRVGGVEVFNEVISVAMDRRLDAVALTGFVTGDVPARHKARGGFAMAPSQAAASALSDALGAVVGAAQLSAPRVADGGYQLLATSVTTEPVRMKQVWFRAADHALVDAYYVEADLGADADGKPRYYSYVVSAADGHVLFKNDLTAYDNPVTYRVWADATAGALPLPDDGPQGNATTPLPGASNNFYTVPFIAPSMLTISSLTGLGVGDDWLPVGATETLGNNVDAYADIASPDGFTPGADFRADMTAPGIFDRVLDTAADPSATEAQRKAGITQLFYNVNFWHDWYYVSGFDEAAGNAQIVNYGRGGVQGDPIRGEAQDSSGKNNANMQTPADGARPRMQMYLWDFGTAELVTTSPSAASFTNLGLPSAWGATNFNLPDTTAIVRGVPNDGCAALTGTYTGQIVLVDRGTCGFSQKAGFAEAAGAAGVIIANVAASANPTVAPGMALTAGQVPVPMIPAFSINLADGNTLRTAVAAGPVTGGMSRSTSLRDGDIDNSVMAHEWGHFISNRLIFNANGLGTNMARGLGEGWADTHAMLMTVREGDDLEPTNATWNGVYAVAAYGSGSIARGNPYYFGIRRYPYSTDLTRNPLMFRHIGDGNPLPVGPPSNGGAAANSQVHNTGEVWATMLWECYASLLRDTQGASPRLTFVQARDRWKDYLVAAYKVTPANPTLLEARDAVLAVALANDPVDYARFTAAFARRGAGVFAVAPDRNSATNMPVVESFAVGAGVVATAVTVTDTGGALCNEDGVLDSGETGTLTVTFKNVGNAPLAPSSATASSATAGITFPDGASIAIPAMAQFQTVTATVAIAAIGLTGVSSYDVTVAAPDAGSGAPPPVTFQLLGNYDVVNNSSFTDSVEPPTTRWTITNNPLALPAADSWQRATVSPTDHRWNAPSASQASTADLVSPQLFVTSSPFTLTFRHRFSFEQPVFDGGVIEISTDGGLTYTDVGGTLAGYNGTLGTASQNPIGGRAAYVNQSAGYPAFATRTLDFGNTYLGRSVLVRFRVGSDAGTASAGWDIDDIQVSGVSSPPFAALVAQPAACNNLPVAHAGLSRSVGELTAAPAFGPVSVILDGSASFDADGSPLTYTWEQILGPAVTLSDATARQPTFTAPLVARAASPVALIFQLTVSDGTSTSPASLVQVNVTNVNRPPVASAGAGQDVGERTAVTLTGAASADPDSDDTLTYAWTQTAGPMVTLSSATAASPTFTAPEVTAATALTFRLIVNDGLAASAASTVTVNVADVNQAPAASAGANQTVPEMTPAFAPVTVTLDASGSADPEGTALTYAWTQTAGPTVTLSDATAAQPTFTAPLVPRAGTTVLAFQVVASDASLPSAPATTSVTVTNVNRPPVASAGPAATSDERTVVTLDGRASSDPDADDTLTYAWTQTAGPTVTLSSATGPQPSFTAPEVNGDTDVTLSLIVNDGLAASAPSTVTITLNDVNLAPTAIAGPAQTVPERSTVTLAGSATDPESDTPITYAWTAPAGITLSDAAIANPTFTAPDVTVATPYTFTLVVTDPSTASSAPAQVTITVTNVNRPPIADAGQAITTRSGQLVALGGSATDPDGDTAFTWTWFAPVNITLTGETSATPTFTAPGVAENTDFTFTLVVSDASGDVSAASTVTVTVQPALHTPVADAGQAIIVRSGASVQLDGDGSSDPDGGELTYAWTQTAGTTVALDDATARNPRFTAPVVTAEASLTFQLVVTSPSGTSAPASVSVFVVPEDEVEPPPPPEDGGCCSSSRGGPGAGQVLFALLPLAVIFGRRRRRRA